ncbi:heptaprenyl diphosphate synthase component 1 [Virgibacillus byunsanensis]|uniref:Heptaprenyl diphosphate synthase component 1 n=1 Tax=Virgibacillus byunsanensis TaxID=570945 RepID=A0ABW3LL84_9BACI
MDINDMKQMIEEKLQHTYLDKYIKKPKIDEEKLLILTAIINNTNLPDIKKKQYIITTMLVQIALDTHDLVSNTNGSDGKKPKQLTVLAGDYYSGLYYFLLSEIEDFRMIEILASAIKEINEYKMKIYYREPQSIHEFFRNVKKVESTLVLYVADFLQQAKMKNISEEWLFVNKLIQEKNQVRAVGFSPLFEDWLHEAPKENYNSLLFKVETIIQEKIVDMKNYFSNGTLSRSSFTIFTTPLVKDILTKETSAVEEG